MGGRCMESKREATLCRMKVGILSRKEHADIYTADNNLRGRSRLTCPTRPAFWNSLECICEQLHKNPSAPSQISTALQVLISNRAFGKQVQEFLAQSLTVQCPTLLVVEVGRSFLRGCRSTY
jgi:hypothetical protein